MKQSTHSNYHFIPVIICIIFISCIFPNYSFAKNIMQRLDIPSSPNPVGSGARALGMGGAFIAVADDATAASWNPAGLTRLDRPEISFVGTGFHRVEDNSFYINPEADGKQTISRINLNYLSAACPFSIMDYNMAVSLNYQHLYDFTRKWNFPLIHTGEDSWEQQVDYQSEGSLTAIGLAYCVQITEHLAFGFTANLWDNGLTENEWEKKTYQWGTGTDGGDRFIEEWQSYDKYSMNGINLNLGLLWKNVFNTNITIGAVFKTPFEADIENEHLVNAYTQYPDLPSKFDFLNRNSYTEDLTLDMPMSYGIGLAYKFSGIFMIALDIYRTEWDDFVLKDSKGNKKSPITGKDNHESDIDPTHQVRLGMEYLVYQTPEYGFPLCLGLFYDPAPAEGSPDDFFGFSIGSGIVHKEWFTFDIAYQYRFGNNVGSSILEEFGLSQDVEEHTVYTSIIVYF